MLIRHRYLIQQLVLREIFARYRGSFLGLVWMMLNPLLLLVMFSFVFNHLFPARWDIIDTATIPVALVLFAGIITHQFMADCFIQTPSVILEHPNFVKRVIFPVEILVPVKVIANGCVFLFQWFVLLFATIFLTQNLYWFSLLWLPLLLVPFILMLTGLGWIFASIGLFLRDLRQMMSMAVLILLFMGPVLYPTDIFPEIIQPFLYLNPAAFPIESLRNLLLWGKQPAWNAIGIYWLASVIVGWVGYQFFRLTRRGFADVI